jgi:hypothetical protein
MALRSSSNARKLYYALNNILYHQPDTFFNLLRSDAGLQARFLDLVRDVCLLDHREDDGDRAVHDTQTQWSNEQEPLLEGDDEEPR